MNSSWVEEAHVDALELDGDEVSEAFVMEFQKIWTYCDLTYQRMTH